MAGGERPEAVFDNGVVGLGACLDISTHISHLLLDARKLSHMVSLYKANELMSNNAGSGLQRSTKSGRGLPVAFLSAPVMTKAPPELSSRPRTPMFSSHSRSFMR